MADNPLVVALLKEYKDEATVTRTEVGRMIGKNRNQVAGICDRNYIVGWPNIPIEVKRKRACQFPTGVPGEADFKLCDKRRDVGHSLCCPEHRDKQWKPECKVISMST